MLNDPEVRLLASIAEGLQDDFAQDDRAWAQSPFGWIKRCPSRQVGVIGEKLVAGWCAARDLDVIKSPDSDADRVIEGRRTEIKFSTLWRNGSYCFQQIRDQNYETLICLGVSPFDAHCWIFSKSDIVPLDGSKYGLTNQHGGSRGKDTAWLKIVPTDPSPWLAEHGGRLKDAMQILRRMANLE